MSFFYFLTAGLDLHLGIFQLVFITVIIFNSYIPHYVNPYHIDMPVITRSQSHLLTCLATESSKATNLLTSSSFESSEVASTSKNLSLKFNNKHKQIFPSLQHELRDSSISDDVLSRSSHCSSTAIPFQNFKIPNLTTVGNSKSVSNTTSHFIHNYVLDKTVTMEADCKDSDIDTKLPSESVDLSQLILSLSHQISQQTLSIQDWISTQNDVLQDQTIKYELQFQTVIQENEELKRTVHAELDQLKTLFVSSMQGLLPKSETSIVRPSNPIVSSSVPSVSIPSLGSTNWSSSDGVQGTSLSSTQIPTLASLSSVKSQVMLMLAESFSKLSSVLIVDKGTESKVEWPKFAGDSKLFKGWYLAIFVQLSIPPWKELYDESTRDIVKVTSNAVLNQKLYAKILTFLESTALQSIVALFHLHSDGLQVLQDLTATHRPVHVPEIIAAKTVQFWGSTRCMSNEMVDANYYHFKELLDEIQDADGPIPTKCHETFYFYIRI
jgi:hypothetical protein